MHVLERESYLAGPKITVCPLETKSLCGVPGTDFWGTSHHKNGIPKVTFVVNGKVQCHFY